MGFGLSGDFGFSEWNLHVGDSNSWSFGHGGARRTSGFFILLVGYSCLLVLLGRRCGRKVRLDKVVAVKRAENRFQHGVAQLCAGESDDGENRRISVWADKDDW